MTAHEQEGEGRKDDIAKGARYRQGREVFGSFSTFSADLKVDTLLFTEQVCNVEDLTISKLSCIFFTASMTIDFSDTDAAQLGRLPASLIS